MEYIYAALLLHNSGKEVTEDGVKAVMDAAGIKADKGRVKALISALSDVNIDEAMEQQAQPVYAPAAVAPPTAMPAEAPAATPEAAEAEKKEKKKKKEGEEEKAEETGMGGLSSLFG
ncbi:MAG: 50S ribosomal protein P1 [Halobacteriota archaeon]